MLANLLNIPKTQQDWDNWSWSHRQSHAAIRDAVQKQFGVTLPDYQIDPIPQDKQGFLEANRQLHDQMMKIVGGDPQDLQQADLNDSASSKDWHDSHYQEHLNTEQRLGIGS